MYIMNDAMFSLILRFTGCEEQITFYDQEFLQKRLKDIRDYVEQFPPSEQDQRAMEWIEKHALEYRKTWETKVIENEVSAHRCPDCPVANHNGPEHCPIHDQWLKFLQQYVMNAITSREYVWNNLKLLASHKDDLKVKVSTLEGK